MFEEFGFDLLRKYIITFGTLFNDIHVTRTGADGAVVNSIKVPITYGPKDKMLSRVIQDPQLERPMATIPLPAMSFEITGMQYDGSRKLQTVNKHTGTSSDSTKRSSQYAPVPYNIMFELTVMCKNAEDGTRIVEQILPYFTPDWTVTAHLIPEMDVTHDIPVILQNISMSDHYDGDFRDRRALTWTIQFVMKGYFYGPIKQKKVIKYVKVQLFAPALAADETLQDVTDTAEPNVLIEVEPGLTTVGEPTSNAALSIAVGEIEATDNYGYVVEVTEY